MSTSRESRDWSENEVVLAMDLYITLGREPDDTDPDVLELSHLIGRKPAAVTFKIGNLRSIETAGLHGFRHAGAIDKKVWARFVNDHGGLRALAAKIRRRLSSKVPVGWIFKADASKGWLVNRNAHPGNTESWEKVPATAVTDWAPVLLMQCGTSEPGFYGRGTILPPKGGSSHARVRYDEVFRDPFLFEDANPESISGATWDDGRLPYLLGLESPRGKKAAPCRMQGAYFRISERDAASLAIMFPGLRWLRGDSTPESEQEGNLERVGRGQGFFTGSSARRKRIEEIAMRRAWNYFEGKNYKVQDFHKTRPYDLKCVKESETVYVEVKGTTSKGERILVTPGEVNFALRNSSKMALFVLSSIQLGRRNPEAGGKVRIERPWRILRRNLSPTGYLLQL